MNKREECCYVADCTEKCEECQLAYMPACFVCGQQHLHFHWLVDGEKVCEDCARILDPDHDFGDDDEDYQEQAVGEPEWVKCGCSNGYTGPAGDTCPR